MTMDEALKDNRFKEIYQNERNKLSIFPDADCDFIALENALRHYSLIKAKN